MCSAAATMVAVAAVMAVIATRLVLNSLAERSNAAEAAAENGEEDPSNDVVDCGSPALILISASSIDGTSEWALVSISIVEGATWSSDNDDSSVVVAVATTAAPAGARAAATAATTAATAASFGVSDAWHAHESKDQGDEEKAENLRDAHIS